MFESVSLDCIYTNAIISITRKLISQVMSNGDERVAIECRSMQSGYIEFYAHIVLILIVEHMQKEAMYG